MMIIHIDTGKTWRGGQQQAFYLHQALLQRGYDSTMVCKHKSIMALKCHEHNLKYKTLSLNSEIDILSAYKIARYAKKHKAVILHLHTAHALSIGLWVKIFYRPIKLIAVRRVDFSIKKSIFSYLKYNNNLLDILVCISKNIYNVAIKDGISEEKLRVIYSGIDTQRYSLKNIRERESYNREIRDRYDIPRENILIGTIAAYADHKDYPTLLKAASIVTTQKDNITFLSIGGGEVSKEIKDLHKSLRLENRFIIAGFQEGVKQHLHSFDIFVLASKMEGLGTTILDAMSAEKPIVACNSGGIPEMIEHNVNGLLAKRENPSDFAKKMLQIIDDRDLQRRLSAQAATDVQKFSIQNTIEQNIELYLCFI